MSRVFASATDRIEVHRYAEIQLHGDTAVAEYDYTNHLSLKDPEVWTSESGALTASTSARYCSVLRRQDGEWQVWRHTWQVYTA